MTEFSEIPPLCKCGNILRPDVVWRIFTTRCMAKSYGFGKWVRFDVVVGTSLVVSPVNTLPIYAQQNNAIMIEINPENTEMSSEMDLVIKDSSTVALPKLVSIFQQN